MQNVGPQVDAVVITERQELEANIQVEEEHGNQNNKRGPITCITCDFRTDDVKEFDVHLKEKHSPNIVQEQNECGNCDARY